MSGSPPGTPDLRLAAIARGFVLLALGGPMLWNREVSSIVALAALTVGWLVLLSLEGRAARARGLLTVVDAAFVGVVCATTIDTTSLLGALAVPPFLAGLRMGLRGVLLALSAELTLTTALGLVVGGQLSQEVSLGIFTWAVMGVALGMVATFVRAAMREDDPLAPYRHASDLLHELNDLTGALSAGLEPRTLGGLIASTVGDDLPTAGLGLYVPRQDGLTPLVTQGDDAALADCLPLVSEAWDSGDLVVAGQAFAFALGGERDAVAVVAGRFSDRVRMAELDLRRRVKRLRRDLHERVVHLETGLLFEAFRDAATAEERKRLSREMHDGVAQDIASLGYLVDALAAGATDPVQEQQLGLLRKQVSSVVAEVRRSVMSLRTTIGSSESLGTAIGSIARNLAQVSGVAIEVTLDEQAQRLRPEVEAELFRITQEALNNAVKHSGCSLIRVHCQVTPPAASIVVHDDGRGLGGGRSDSYGMGIMRERAQLIDAELTVSEPPEGGLAVGVRIGAPLPTPSTREAEVTR